MGEKMNTPRDGLIKCPAKDQKKPKSKRSEEYKWK
jgi:hypothetical protein